MIRIISQDADNTHGANNGAGTVTLLDNSVKKDYTYLIGIEDYGRSITNGINTELGKMVGSSITYPNECTFYCFICFSRFYFFGCLSVTADGQFTFARAPEATFFAGAGTDNWIPMMEQYC